jgi:hypothetical protein
MPNTTLEDEALAYFRKLVSFLYREIGAMRRENHPTIFDRSTLASSGFSKSRKQEARRIYFETLSSRDVREVVAPYRTKTGLSIEDVRDAFRDGDWLLRARRYFFGGPKWARIADVTLELGQAISVGRWDLVPQLIAEVNVLRHNNGRIVDKFGELARDGQ